mgnify:CR=1 FL=1
MRMPSSCLSTLQRCGTLSLFPVVISHCRWQQIKDDTLFKGAFKKFQMMLRAPEKEKEQHERLKEKEAEKAEKQMLKEASKIDGGASGKDVKKVATTIKTFKSEGPRLVHATASRAKVAGGRRPPSHLTGRAPTVQAPRNIMALLDSTPAPYGIAPPFLKKWDHLSLFLFGGRTGINF